jgi:glycosylphosphatidylinositol transamidase (GPIT) subunit GPI8
MNSSSIERVIHLATKDTKKGARVVAKVFYRILRKQGFSDNQIIDITSNILSCLIEKLSSCERKQESSREPVDHNNENIQYYS